MLAKEANKSQN